MKSLIGSIIGLVLSVHVGAEPLLEGRVRLSSGQPAADVQVRLFDLTDLRRSVGTTTDAAGFFALSLQTLSGGTALPTNFALGQNYPNPFNPSTVIPYQRPAAGHVRLEVFNVLGQRLATLVDAEQSAGTYTAQWDATDASGRAMGAGVYIYRLSSGGMTESRRMVLVDGQAGIPAIGAAQGPVRAEEGAVEADDRVYGLTVSGEGLVAYVNPAFRVGVDAADIVVEEHGGNPRMKLTTGRILGDVNNDGQVDAFDALYVLLYSEDSSITLPNNGDISLGDVNGDGQVDLADAVLLATYSVNPSDPSLPPGIGQAAPDLVASSGTSEGQDTAFSHIYWRDSGTGKIQRADLDGSNIEDLVTIEGSSVYGPYGLALDMNGGKIYWTTNDPTYDRDKIQSANLNGSNIETVFIIESDISDLALDTNEGKLYWTDEVYDGIGADRGDKIRRTNLDGSNIETVFITESDISNLTLDGDGDKMYWTKLEPSTLESEIWRANLDGSNIETLVTGLDNRLSGLALDVAEGKIYWTETFVSRFGSRGYIQRANLDGSNIETLVTIDDASGLRGIILDVAGGKMYWTVFKLGGYRKSGKIQRANLDGSNIETLVSGLEEPAFCALGGFYEPPNLEETRTRSREEARSELSERSIPYSQSSFITYAQNGDLDVVRLFVEAGMDVNAQPYSSSVAHTTETKPDSSFVAVWFPQPGDEDDDTALMKAAGQGHIEVVRFLVEQGAYLNIRNRQDQDALMFAAAGGHLAAAIFLIDIAPVATAPCVIGGPQQGPNIVCKSSLLYDAGASRSSYSSGPQSALEWAVYNGHLNMVHVLLENSLRRDGFRYTVSMSLAWAAYRGHLDVARLLLEYGALVDFRPSRLGGEQGPTPLMLAAYSGQLDMVRLLLDHGADIQYRAASIRRVTETRFGPVIDIAIGAGALHMAINQGHVEVLRLLLEHWMWEYGADSRGPYGMSTLMYAAAAGDLEMARLLLENGVPINAQSDVGTTALMFAAAEGHVEMVRFLVENRADIHIQNGYNYTALSLAEERGHQEVVDFLRSVEDAG